VDEDRLHISIDKRLLKIGLLVGILLITVVVAFAVSNGGIPSGPESTQFSFTVPASIDEVYPLFMCPCCGQPLDPERICCGQAKERIAYIDALSDAGISNGEIVLTTAKKYGINSLINDSMKEDVKVDLGRRAPEDRPKISIDPIRYDFGNVSVSGGVVSTEVTIKNNGKSDLIIDNIETSCMCTTALITIEDVKSPVFGMNMGDGKHPTGWNETIRVGDSAVLTIYYDPQMHGEMRGPLTRTIKVFSNDPVEFQKEVRIEANQID
jgi:hypothetical protein